ncbi:hypothetical protein J7I98_10080 [Streptomyces sp. ISL-98]|uniref:hypothetical protein n=1 Tax=Streptomyces sp. ISL-98 TaxID=2819192 RepID=UPI001BEA2EDE|nr:hypothetical protein [Streptomyces sp. ISL-98]MBT2506242.1 hypothetical protein [Streptomyces sp. ISL-98]
MPESGTSADGRKAGLTSVRRGSADPVRALMHRHRALCERAVDPLEIAAGLEAHGVTDRTAARFRHRDVFSLAEELYARVPRLGDDGQVAAAAEPPAREELPRAGWIAYALLPGVVCALTVAGLDMATGQVRLAVGVLGALAVAGALALCLRNGPLRAPGRTAPAARLWALWLIGYAVFGDGLLGEIVDGGPGGAHDGGLGAAYDGGPIAAHDGGQGTTYDGGLGAAQDGGPGAAHDGDLSSAHDGGSGASSGATHGWASGGPWSMATVPFLGLAAALAPAAWCAHLLSVQARRKLAASRGTEEFAEAARPLLLGVTALFVCVLLALQVAVGIAAGGNGRVAASAVALGALLFLARLLTVHGFPESASAGLAAATAVQITALAAVLAARLPGFGLLARPVEAVVQAGGAGAVPAVACAAAALGLLVHATAALSRASAHAARHD